MLSNYKLRATLVLNMVELVPSHSKLLSQNTLVIYTKVLELDKCRNKGRI